MVLKGNLNRDIDILITCKPALMEVSALRERDMEEQKAYLGSPRLDGMPRGSGGSGMEEALMHAENLRRQRVAQMNAYEELVTVCEMILRKVPMQTRPIVRLLYVDQLPIWRVAQIVHISESTIKRIKADAERKEKF